jgi:hypothetical protein
VLPIKNKVNGSQESQSSTSSELIYTLRNSPRPIINPDACNFHNLGIQIRKISHRTPRHLESAFIPPPSSRHFTLFHVLQHPPLVHSMAKNSLPMEHPLLRNQLDALRNIRHPRRIFRRLAPPPPRRPMDLSYRSSKCADFQSALSYYAREADLLGTGIPSYDSNGVLSGLCLYGCADYCE